MSSPPASRAARPPQLSWPPPLLPIEVSELRDSVELI